MSGESFWTTADERHREIARTFYENIEYDHPDYITSNGQGHRFCPHCIWERTSVKYYRYNGPRVVNI